jgi:DNA-binding MarR family transcriptional regulator
MTDDSGDESSLWLSLSDLARQRGITKQVLSRQVTRFEGMGLIETRDGKGGRKLICVADFNRAANAMARRPRRSPPLDPAEAMARRNDTLTAAETLTRENARKAAYLADLAKLNLEERLGRLVVLDDIVSATVQLGETIIRQIDQLPSRAEEFAAAVAKDGKAGARMMLKDFVADVREAISRDLAALASPSSAGDEAIQHGRAVRC